MAFDDAAGIMRRTLGTHRFTGAVLIGNELLDVPLRKPYSQLSSRLARQRSCESELPRQPQLYVSCIYDLSLRHSF